MKNTNTREQNTVTSAIHVNDPAPRWKHGTRANGDTAAYSTLPFNHRVRVLKNGDRWDWVIAQVGILNLAIAEGSAPTMEQGMASAQEAWNTIINKAVWA